MPEQHSAAEYVAEQFDIDYNADEIDAALVPIAKEIANSTGLRSGYNQGEAYLAEVGDVLCIKGRPAIPAHLTRKIDENEHVRISHINSKQDRAYIEVRPTE